MGKPQQKPAPKPALIVPGIAELEMYFRDEEPAAGHVGDSNGWNAIETALYQLRYLTEYSNQQAARVHELEQRLAVLERPTNVRTVSQEAHRTMANAVTALLDVASTPEHRAVMAAVRNELWAKSK